MNSCNSSATKLKQIEDWLSRLDPAEQLNREQTEWLLREAASAAATVGAAETWMVMHCMDAARATNRGLASTGGEGPLEPVEPPVPAEDPINAAVWRNVMEFCGPSGVARGQTARPAEAKAKAVVAVKATAKTVAAQTQPSWWASPKPPPPKPPPAGWAPPEPVVDPQEAAVARAILTDWGAAGQPPPPAGAAQMGFLAQPYKAPPDVPTRTVRFADVHCMSDLVGHRGRTAAIASQAHFSVATEVARGSQ